MFIDYADCVFTRTLWQTESRVNGEDFAAKKFPPERLVQIVFAEAIDELGLKREMETELRGVSLNRLKFLRALHTICLKDDESVFEALGAYPNHDIAFNKLRESRRRFFRDLNVNKAKIDEKQEKEYQLTAKRQDISKELKTSEDLLSWLIQHGPDPDFWHVIVCNTNPDGREKIYAWIAAQAECDAGTAAQIFHNSNAYEALEYPMSEFPLNNPAYNTAKLAADRWAENNFRTHRFSPNDIYSSTTYEDFKRIECSATKKFGAPAFRLSDGLFDDKSREEPATSLYFSDF